MAQSRGPQGLNRRPLPDPPPAGDLRIPLYPWSSLLLYALCLSLLAYSPLSFTVKSWILVFGLFLPALWTLASKPRAVAQKVWDAEVFPMAWFPLLPLAALGLAAFRVWEWSQGRAWPTADESITGTQALLLLEKGGWERLRDLGQMPPLWPLAVSFLLRLTRLPFLSLWLPCGLCYLATTAMGYLACRRFFGRSFSLLAAFLLASSYWLLSLQRLSYQETSLPLWVLACLWALGRYLRFPAASRRKRDALGLGLLLGLGPFTFFSFFPVTLALGWFFLSSWGKGPNRRPALLSIFLAGFSLGSALFLLCAGHGLMERVWAILGFQNGWKDQLLVVSNYFTSLFGGTFGGWTAYLLWGGGLLNPLSGALVLTGLLEWARVDPVKRSVAALGLALAALGPGLLSNTVDPFRIVQTLPLVVLLAAMGLQGALAALREGALRKGLLAALLLGSLAFDLARLEGPVWDIRGQGVNFAQAGCTLEKFQAFQPLQDLQGREGPGLIFSEFTPQTRDQSLAYATYPWNAAWDPGLGKTGARWAALLCPDHYVFWLRHAFPQGRWFHLDSQFPGVPGFDLLGVLPVDGRNAPLLASWAGLYPAYQRINMEELDLANGISRHRIVEDLCGLYARVPADPFLQSIFLEKLLFEVSWENTFHPESSGSLPRDLAAILGQAFEKSCQDPVLCGKYGKWLFLEGDRAGAEKVFKKGLAQDPGNGALKDDIRRLR